MSEFIGTQRADGNDHGLFFSTLTVGWLDLGEEQRDRVDVVFEACQLRKTFYARLNFIYMRDRLYNRAADIILFLNLAGFDDPVFMRVGNTMGRMWMGSICHWGAIMEMVRLRRGVVILLR